MVFPVCYILETLVILRSLKRSNNFFIKNIGNDVVEFDKNCFEVVIGVSFSGATAHVTCMKKEQDHLLDNQKKFIR